MHNFIIHILTIICYINSFNIIQKDRILISVCDSHTTMFLVYKPNVSVQIGWKIMQHKTLIGAKVNHRSWRPHKILLISKWTAVKWPKMSLHATSCWTLLQVMNVFPNVSACLMQTEYINNYNSFLLGSSCLVEISLPTYLESHNLN